MGRVQFPRPIRLDYIGSFEYNLAVHRRKSFEEESPMPYTTDQYEGMLAETITIQGHNGDAIHAYMAKPMGAGPFPGIVLIPHGFGWTEQQKETLRRFAYRGYIGLCPDIWCRSGHGTPEDVLAKVRAEGGLPDDQVVGDVAGSAQYIMNLPIGQKWNSRAASISGVSPPSSRLSLSHGYCSCPCQSHVFMSVVPLC